MCCKNGSSFLQYSSYFAETINNDQTQRLVSIFLSNNIPCLSNMCITKTIFSLYVVKQQWVNEFLFFILAKTFITYNPLIRYLHKQKMKVFLHITSNHLWYLSWIMFFFFFWQKKTLWILLNVYKLEYPASILYLTEIRFNFIYF